MLIHVFPVCQGVGGALTVLMKDTIRPNLMQTLEVSFTSFIFHFRFFHIAVEFQSKNSSATELQILFFYYRKQSQT